LACTPPKKAGGSGTVLLGEKNLFVVDVR
jgi:hypothetical protein